MRPPTVTGRVALWALGFPAYATASFITAWLHEPWADEAQSWLLARDASVAELWTRLLHYEGTPGLWHTLLHVLQRCGLHYRGLNIFSAVIGCAAVFVLMRYAPFPAWVRLLLPFTFFLAYQYPVIARSYSLLPLLTFVAAVLLVMRPSPAPFWLVSMLVLMAAVSVHGFAMSAAISVYVVWRTGWNWPSKKRAIAAAAVYVVCLILLASAAWPAKDVIFPVHVNAASGRVLQVSGLMFRQAFAGNSILTAAALALSLPFLWKGGGLGLFVLVSVSLCAVSSVVYWQPWTQGLLFLGWVAAIWISANRTAPGPAPAIALAIVIACQLYWSARSMYYDWHQSYSGSRDAAQYIGSGACTDRVAGLGYSTTALQPYFPRNIFVNFDRGFWDWSSRNRTEEASLFFSTARPDCVVVGYKAAREQERRVGLLNRAGYDSIRRFPGNLFWEDRIYEPESFEVYKRARDVELPEFSVIGMADAAASSQLLSGFYGVESGSWRWTARRFSVLLRAPDGAVGSVELTVKFIIPPVQIQRLGSMTLAATVDRQELTPETYSTAGEVAYRRTVPASALVSEAVPVSFEFDKALAPSSADARELAAIAVSASLSKQFSK